MDRRLIRIKTTPLDEGRRLDIFLSEKSGLTRSQVKKLIEAGKAHLKGKKLKPGDLVRPGMEIELEEPQIEAGRLIPEPIPINILFRDDYIAVVDKPAGMVVYPAAGHVRGTLMNALAFHVKKLATIGAPLRAGVVHRLDKDTSGVMVVALDDKAYYGLLEQFRERTIKRAYTALIYGSPKEDEGAISLKIGRSEADRKKMSTKVKRGREALTRWRVLRRFKGATLIEARLGTGRTHQIRVHLAALGHPVLGDKVYGKKTFIEADKKKIHIPRQMLHAKVLGFIHPITGAEMEFESPVPQDMKEILRILNTLKRF
jgi:23S rRNA pseudouridine1911/1915/1917 synthase